MSGRDARSVSSTLHDRSRMSGPGNTVVSNNKSSTSRHHNAHNPHRPHSAMAQTSVGGSGSSPPSARETFLNYFFGQNGPGPMSGSNVDRSHNPSQQHSGGNNTQSIVPIGRDTTGADLSMSSGILAGKRNLDGNNAAFDMKSLGKHIEAVSCFSLLLQHAILTAPTYLVDPC